MIADILQAEFYRRGWPEKYREATPKEKGEWVRLGGGAPAYIGSGGQITKACPGLKGETVKGITGESDESRGQRKARQDVADQHGVKGGELTAEQARGLTQEHEEDEGDPWDQGGSPVPSPRSPQDQPGGARAEAKRASINPKTRFGQAVLETAQEWGVAPDDLADACQFVYEEKARQSQARESAKAHARQTTGLTQRDVGRLANSGYDYTSAKNVGGPTGDKLRQFDVWATEIARHYPGLIGNADDPNADLAGGLWDLIAEGRQVVPPIHDPGVMREAANLALANRGDTGGAYEFEEAGAVPFARRGTVERYRRWMFARENQYRRVTDHYSKRSEPMQEQTYPPINPVEVEHYDKERSKDHEVSPDIKAQIRELTDKEEELLSGIDKSDAPSNKGKKKE